jgi:LacI family transcriptional regulator
MTVSRTLSGGKYVRPELQARVLAAVKKLGYRRNENARSIRPGQASGLVGLIITNLTNPYYGQLAYGIEQVAAPLGRRILLGNSGESLEREERLVEDFASRQVEGLIVVPASNSTAHLEQLGRADIPLVLASRAIAGFDADTVLLNDVHGAYQATALAAAKGHREFAFLGSGASVSTVTRRLDGFTRALADAGLTPNPAMVFRGAGDVASAELAMNQLLAMPTPPTAIFAANNRNATGALRAIGHHREGWSGEAVPTVIAFDDIELGYLLDIPLITLSHDPVELGTIAAQMLFSRIGGAGPQSPARRELPVALKLTNWD